MQGPDDTPPPAPGGTSRGGGSWKYPTGIAVVVFGVIALRGFRGDALDTGLAVVGILGALGLWMLDRAIG